MLIQLTEKFNVEDVKFLEELFIQEGILFDLSSVEEESDIDDLTLQVISLLQAAMEKLTATVDEVRQKCAIIFFSQQIALFRSLPTFWALFVYQILGLVKMRKRNKKVTE